VPLVSSFARSKPRVGWSMLLWMQAEEKGSRSFTNALSALLSPGPFPHSREKRSKRASACVRRLSHSAQLVELGTYWTLCEAPPRLGNPRDFERCHDALIVLVLAGARQVPGKRNHLAPMLLSYLPVSAAHFRSSLCMASSKTAADESHKRAPMLIGVTK